MVRTVNWGLVGASDIAATRMVPAMRRLGHRVVGVMSGSREYAEHFASANNIGSYTVSLDELVGHSEVQAVYVSSTNERHYEQVLAAASAGKHVLCEKPLALSVPEAWEMVTACENAKTVLATNHHLPAAGTHRTIRALVARGAVGVPLAVRVFHAVSLPERLRGWRLSSPARGGGVILDITCHDAAAVQAVLGSDALEAVALSVRQGLWEAKAEDAVMSVIRFEGQVLVQTHDAFTVGHAGTGLEVHGTDGSIIATDVMTQDPVGQVVLRDDLGSREVPVDDRRDLYEVTLEAFARAIAGEALPVVNGAAGAKAVAIALAVKQAAESGRTVPVEGRPASSPAGERRAGP